MTAQPAGTIETGAGYSIMVCGELIWKPLIGDRVLLGQSGINHLQWLLIGIIAALVICQSRWLPF